MTDSATSILRLVKVTKGFGTQKVLCGVDLEIEPAKTTVILGPSGSGKSVMLKHFVGLLRPDDGEVHFDGARIDRYSERQFGPVRLQVALVFQMSALFDSLTVYENLEFPLAEHSRLSRRERDERIQEALATVDLAGVEQKLPSQLSGGQRKRVALARAIVMRPRVVLYDEPTTGLDPVRADGINELILKLQRTLGVTSVVVTHDLVSAKKIADRVVVLQHGVLAADGTYAQIENHPDPAVQRFMAGRYDPADSDQVDDPTAPDPFALKERASS